MPLMLLKTITPRNLSCSMARRSSATDAAGSQSGKRGKRRRRRPRLSADDAGKSVIHESAPAGRRCAAFYVCAGRGESDDLRVNAGLVQDLFAIFNVAMAGHGDVVVARIMQAADFRLESCVDADRAGSLFKALMYSGG